MISKVLIGAIAAAQILLVSSSFAAPLKVVTTLPDLAELVRDVGGSEVKVTALLTGVEDPHYLDAQPNFIAKVANADMVCMIGLELENSWMGKILQRSGNADIQPGGKGYCETGKGVKVLEEPHGHLDRSAGHVHAAGNPHFNLSPVSMGEAAGYVHDILVKLRPAKAAEFAKGLKSFRAKMAAVETKVKAKFDDYLRKHTKRPSVMEYHEDFIYYLSAYNIRSAGAIEAQPGTPPSAAQLAKASQAAKQNSVTIALGSMFSPTKHLQQFTRISGVPFAQVATMVQPADKRIDSISKLQLHIADVILGAHGAKVSPTN